MENQDARRSDRVPLELPIVVAGTDALGETFLEQSRTILLGRHGAKIILAHKLVPNEEINVRCLTTSRESDARVVGQLGSEGESYYYGIELLDTDVNLWDIEFPGPDESEAAVGRVLLECMHCHHRELVYLNEFEMEVLETNQDLSRHCRRCADMTMWKRSAPQEGAEIPPPEPVRGSRPRRTRNDRKHVRLQLKVEVCIRHPQFGEEVATTVNVARGGFRFKSRRGYGEGWVIEASLPYSRKGANIFTPARIVYVGEMPDEDAYVYGVMYLPKIQAEVIV
jgi:PilZ domain